MSMDSTLNVTPEGSLGDLPATVGGVEEIREGTHQVSEEKLQDGSPSTNVITSTEETPETLESSAQEKFKSSRVPKKNSKDQRGK